MAVNKSSTESARLECNVRTHAIVFIPFTTNKRETTKPQHQAHYCWNRTHFAFITANMNFFFFCNKGVPPASVTLPHNKQQPQNRRRRRQKIRFPEDETRRQLGGRSRKSLFSKIFSKSTPSKVHHDEYCPTEDAMEFSKTSMTSDDFSAQRTPLPSQADGRIVARAA